MTWLYIVYFSVALATVLFDRWMTGGMTSEYRDWTTTITMALTWPVVLILFIVAGCSR